MNPRPLQLVVAVLSILTPGIAQQLEHSIADWRIPIHTAQDDPEGGEYGIWASGATYKVSFHDGFAFYPVLGEEYPQNLPLVWRTRSIEVGGTSIVSSATKSTPHHTDWRYEYRYPGVTEAYDVSEKGVEQTFVLHRRPAGNGDLVVRGTVTTKLVAKPQEPIHGPLRSRHGSRLLRHARGLGQGHGPDAVAVHVPGPVLGRQVPQPLRILRTDQPFNGPIHRVFVFTVLLRVPGAQKRQGG